jgi:hypothetical protein
MQSFWLLMRRSFLFNDHSIAAFIELVLKRKCQAECIQRFSNTFIAECAGKFLIGQ